MADDITVTLTEAEYNAVVAALNHANAEGLSGQQDRDSARAKIDEAITENQSAPTEEDSEDEVDTAGKKTGKKVPKKAKR